jgi:hypothetical protein
MYHGDLSKKLQLKSQRRLNDLVCSINDVLGPLSKLVMLLKTNLNDN